MKKTIIAITLISGLVLATAASANWGRGGGRGYAGVCPQGYAAPQGRFYQQPVDPAAQEKFTQFYSETQDLRKQLMMKQAERRALLQSTNPDPATASKLAGEIFDLRNTMQEKAAAAGVSQLGGPGMMGPWDGGGPRGGGPRGGGRMMGGPNF